MPFRPVFFAVLIASLLAAQPAAANSRFSDVDANHPFADAVEWLVVQDITTGTEPGHYSPSRTVTRAQMAVFLWRYSNAPTPREHALYDDVATDDWHADAVAHLTHVGVTEGITDGRYGGELEVTRAQMATFLWRTAGSPLDGVAGQPFEDVPPDHAHARSINWLSEAAITQGVTETRFEPASPVTRGQMAAFLWRLAGQPEPHVPGVNRLAAEAIMLDPAPIRVPTLDTTTGDATFVYDGDFPAAVGDLVLVPPSDAFPDATWGRVEAVALDRTVSLRRVPLAELIPHVDLTSSIRLEDEGEDNGDGGTRTAQSLRAASTGWKSDGPCSLSGPDKDKFTPPRISIKAGPPDVDASLGEVNLRWRFWDSEPNPYVSVHLPVKATLGANFELTGSGECKWKWSGPSARIGTVWVSSVPLVFAGRPSAEVSVKAAGGVTLHFEMSQKFRPGFTLQDGHVTSSGLNGQSEFWEKPVQGKFDATAKAKGSYAVSALAGGVIGVELDPGAQAAAKLDAMCPTPPLADGWLTVTPSVVVSGKLVLDVFVKSWRYTIAQAQLDFAKYRPFAGKNGFHCSAFTSPPDDGGSEPAPDPGGGTNPDPGPGPDPEPTDPGDGSGSFKPRGGAAGDPHLSTFDHLLYDMHAQGEFRFVESTVDDFAVHVRTAFLGESVSYVDEYAVRTPEGEVIVYDGNGVHVDGTTLASGETRTLAAGGTVTERVVELGDGTTVSWAAPSFARSVNVELAPARAGHVRGLLGDADGTADNDGLTSDGRQVVGPGSLDGRSWGEIEPILYDDYAPSWVTLDTDRIFPTERRAYAKPTQWVTFADFPQADIDMARQVCLDNGWVEPELSFCTFDLLVTGDASFADPSAMLGIPASGTTSTGGEPQLTPGSVIAGTVQDGSGIAQDGMCVSAFGYARADGDYAAGSATSDVNGQYAIEGLPAGTYRVEASDCAGRNRAGGYYPAMSTFSDAAWVRVGDFDRAETVDLLTVQGGAVSGTLTRAADGSALGEQAGCVTVFAVTADGLRPYEFNTVGGHTGTDGSYSIQGLLAGDYAVQASPCGWWWGDMENLANAWFNGGAHHQDFNTTPVNVTASGTTGGIDIALPAGAEIAGTVTGPNGTAVDQVCIYASSTWDPLGQGRSAETGADGAYLLTGLSPGDHRLHVADCADRDFVHESVDVADMGNTEHRSGVDVSMTQGGRITGSITDSNGAPPQPESICAMAHSTESNTGYGVRVSATGSFELSGLPAEPTKVSVYECGQADAALTWWDNATSEADATVIDVVAGGSHGPLRMTLNP